MTSVLCRVAATLVIVGFLGGCSSSIRIDMDHNVTDPGGHEAIGTWRNERLRFFERQYAKSLDSNRRAYFEDALVWLDQQQVFACPDEKSYSVQRAEIWAVEFEERAETFTVFVGCCDGYYFRRSSQSFACTGRGDYIRIS